MGVFAWLRSAFRHAPADPAPTTHLSPEQAIQLARAAAQTEAFQDRGEATACDAGRALRRAVRIHREVLRLRLTDRMKCTSAEVQAMESEARQLKAEIDNLVAVVAAGASQVDALVQGLSERQEKLSQLDARIRAAKTAPEAISMELRRVEREARSRLAEFRSALEAHPAEGRTFLTQILAGPLTFTAQKHRYRIEGQVAAYCLIFKYA